METYLHSYSVKAHRLLTYEDAEIILRCCFHDPLFHFCKIIATNGITMEIQLSALTVIVHKGDWLVWDKGTYTTYTDTHFHKNFFLAPQRSNPHG